MLCEVEQKYRVADPAALRVLLAHAGATFGPPVRQVDEYFNHPAHDFAVTDEALRIRRVGEKNFVTYKGPKLDPTVKTRHELELPLADGAPTAEQFAALLVALGFRTTARVVKLRSSAVLERPAARFTVAWDEVERLGTFLEVELVVEPAAADDAKRRILALERELGLADVERRSYLEMVLAASV